MAGRLQMIAIIQHLYMKTLWAVQNTLRSDNTLLKGSVFSIERPNNMDPSKAAIMLNLKQLIPQLSFLMQLGHLGLSGTVPRQGYLSLNSNQY